MLDKIKENFGNGIRKFKWFAAVFSERTKLEIAVIRLLYNSNELAQKREELLRSIGQRVYELKGNPEKNILRDRAVTEAIVEIEALEKEIDELKHKVSELSGAGV